MSITVKYFGAIEEVTGLSEESVSADDFSSLEELKSHLLTKYESLGQLSFQLAVNQSMTASSSLQSGDEVAILPPFAGG